ncbi:ATP-grasp domain-containing protein [Nostoc sp. DedQUE07]|uniref:ATP-grasp domain-containing protein n=1 Tax=Nostoc sp. DedQUE07 TaxID=3075392 RepID=UPI002AD31A5E|nr:ATP-grasp domain-containing protein [Nostoc sp. DedQUE07]MDZ8130479.1 ATP-grasp domain-containing protein [Nostoc sp. DedQUE07]
MKLYKVLVFPGGTEIGLEIYNALCSCKDIQLYSVGLDMSNHAPYVFKNHFSIPSIHDPAWIDSLNKIIIENNIDYIFPAYDDIVISLAINAENIKAKIISSPLETCLITRYKSKTYAMFSTNLPIPKIYRSLDEIDYFPVFIKPDKGQGSQDTHIVYNKQHLSLVLSKSQEYIITEYLPGDEYTIDCFSHRHTGLIFCRGRQRVRTKSGISMNSRSTNNSSNEFFLNYAKLISEKLTFYGAWFFQLKKDKDGNYKLLEIAPRIAGAMAFHRVQGINFSLLSIYEQENIPIEIITNKLDLELDRALINRYKHNIEYKTVYVDLDDTLVINGKLNLSLIQFLYQCVNNNKKIILLTKHTGNINNFLEKYRIKYIFDSIIQIDKSAYKANYILEKNAIFIDDSFTERKSVNTKLSIPTFDSSMIEMLLDYKG